MRFIVDGMCVSEGGILRPVAPPTQRQQEERNNDGAWSVEQRATRKARGGVFVGCCEGSTNTEVMHDAKKNPISSAAVLNHCF
jgi:hypothetical protein